MNQWPRGSTPGSRIRRALTYVVLFLFSLLSVEAVSAHYGAPWFTTPSVGIIVVTTAVVFFVFVCVGVIFLTSQDFRPDPARLARDSLLSILFTIVAFALLYRSVGFSLDATCAGPFGARDSVYFSAVTFSTLGYGDFRPCPDARLVAAAHAIIGNLHLGLIIGAAFLFAQNTRPK